MAQDVDIEALYASSAELPDTDLEDVIDKMVAEHPGAPLYFSRAKDGSLLLAAPDGWHYLFVRHTSNDDHYLTWEVNPQEPA